MYFNGTIPPLQFKYNSETFHFVKQVIQSCMSLVNENWNHSIESFFFFFFNVLLFNSHPVCYPSLCRDYLTSKITFKFIDLYDPRK